MHLVVFGTPSNINQYVSIKDVTKPSFIMLLFAFIKILNNIK